MVPFTGRSLAFCFLLPTCTNIKKKLHEAKKPTRLPGGRLHVYTTDQRAASSRGVARRCLVVPASATKSIFCLWFPIVRDNHIDMHNAALLPRTTPAGPYFFLGAFSFKLSFLPAMLFAFHPSLSPSAPFPASSVSTQHTNTLPYTHTRTLSSRLLLYLVGFSGPIRSHALSTASRIRREPGYVFSSLRHHKHPHFRRAIPPVTHRLQFLNLRSPIDQYLLQEGETEDEYKRIFELRHSIVLVPFASEADKEKAKREKEIRAIRRSQSRSVKPEESRSTSSLSTGQRQFPTPTSMPREKPAGRWSAR